MFWLIEREMGEEIGKYGKRRWSTIIQHHANDWHGILESTNSRRNGFKSKLYFFSLGILRVNIRIKINNIVIGNAELVFIDYFTTMLGNCFIPSRIKIIAGPKVGD